MAVITGITAGDGSLTVRWQPVENASIYWVQYKHSRWWRWQNTQVNESTPHTIRDLPTGEYEVKLKAFYPSGGRRSGAETEWSETHRATIAIASPPTPTPVAPRRRTCEWASSGDPARGEKLAFPTVVVNNPEEPSQLWHERSISWGLWYTFWSTEDLVRYVLTIIDDGRWTLNLHANHKDRVLYTIDHGTIGLDRDWGAQNSFEVLLPGRDVGLRVNGIDVPVEIDQDDRQAITNTINVLRSFAPFVDFEDHTIKAEGTASFEGLERSYDRGTYSELRGCREFQGRY